MLRKCYYLFKRKWKQFKLKLLVIDNNLYVLKNKKNFKNKVAIVTSKRLINKIKEDILLKIALNKMNVNVDIIAWEDNTIDYQKYDCVVIRTIWGYQKNLKKFKLWLDKLEKENINVYNNLKLINDNYNKYKQYMLLDKNNVPVIYTSFIYNKKDINSVIEDMLNIYTSCVVKPIISASGNNTYIISNTNMIRKNAINIDEINDKFGFVFDYEDNGIMVQPFIEEIDNGEISLIYINKELSHAIVRNSSIFNNNSNIYNKDIEELDKELLELGNKISNLKEYDDYLYLRIDMVKYKNHYKVLETELLDPCLFFDVIKNKEEKREKINYMASSIVNKIK